MTRQQQHAARRLVLARVHYNREPDSPQRLRELERAEARYAAACSHTRPSYIKGERL